MLRGCVVVSSNQVIAGNCVLESSNQEKGLLFVQVSSSLCEFLGESFKDVCFASEIVTDSLIGRNAFFFIAAYPITHQINKGLDHFSLVIYKKIVYFSLKSFLRQHFLAIFAFFGLHKFQIYFVNLNRVLTPLSPQMTFVHC